MHQILRTLTYNILIHCVIASNLWSDIIVNSIEQIKVRPQNVIILTYQSNDIPFEYNHLVQKISQKIPITINNLTKTTYLRTLEFKVLKNNALHIIPLHKSDIYDDTKIVYNYLDASMKSNSASPQPKCLIVFFNNDAKVEENFEMLLEYAWSQRFLDFTVVEIILNNNNVVKEENYIYFYNPFFNITKKQMLVKGTCIFPDKLLNLAGFPLNVIFIDATQQGINVYNSKTDSQRLKFPEIEIASKVLKFSINYINVTHINTYQYLELVKFVSNLFKTRVPDLIATPFLKGILISDNLLEIEVPNMSNRLVALVPKLYYHKLIFPLYVFVEFFIYPLLIVIIVTITTKLQIKIEDSSVFHYLKLLFGIPTSVTRPQALIDTIITLSVIILSMSYSIVFYTNFLEIQLTYTEMEFDSFQAIRETQFSIYMNSINYDLIFNDNEMIENLKSQKIFVNDDQEECVKLLLRYKNCFCVMIDSRATEYTEKYRNTDGVSSMKTVDPGFQISYRWSFIFQQSSPYAYKLNSIYKSIFESGITLASQNNIRNKSYSAMGTQFDIVSSSPVFELILILLIGYILSLVTFVIERLGNIWKVRQNYLRKSDKLRFTPIHGISEQHFSSQHGRSASQRKSRASRCPRLAFGTGSVQKNLSQTFSPQVTRNLGQQTRGRQGTKNWPAVFCKPRYRSVESKSSVSVNGASTTATATI